jgi:hypothetical protein
LKLKHLWNDRALWRAEMKDLGKLSWKFAEGLLRKLDEVDVMLSSSEGAKLARGRAPWQKTMLLKELSESPVASLA